MFLLIKKLILSIILNSSFLILLMVGIQNSSNKTKVDLLIRDSVSLPVSFIAGISFIAGSLTGSIFKINLSNDK